MLRVPVMPAAVVIGALAVQILGMKISSKPKDCSEILEECIEEHDLCKNVGRLFESMCDFEGGPCQMEDMEVCNMTIQFLLRDSLLRRGGFCQWEEEPCALLHQLVSKCQPHRDDLNSSAKTSWSSRELIHKSAAPISCLRALQSCQETQGCASAYENMRALCRMEGSNCKSSVASPLCLSLWEDLRRSPLGQCTCNKGRRKCLAIWNLVHKNPCFHKVPEGQVLIGTTLDQKSQQHIPEQKTVPKMQWPDSGLPGYVHGMNPSCSGQMKFCLRDEACNRWLVPVVKACSASQCNQSQCGQRVQKFYEGMPQTTAEALVFCTCHQEDQECQLARASLHGGTCEPEDDWTCLDMLDSCLESLLCRERFGTLSSKCLGIGPVPYESDAFSEWLNLIDSDLSLSRDRECRVALVATMGTTLQRSCTCDGLPNYEFHKCNLLHQLMHNKSNFITHMAVTGAPDESIEADGWRRAQWWLSDDLLSICVYILLVVTILSVVVIVLHKLGRMQKRVADQLRYDTPSQKNNDAGF